GAASITTYVLSKRLSKPIIKLRNAAEAISKGEFGARTKINTNDEIGDLSSAFDNMARTIQETITAITKRENIIKRQENLLLKFSEEKQDCCVCLVDMVGGKKISSSLS
ncbi:MAG: HAMP domain-containing protein, partial [Nitrosopumilaceae archaeon]|nr:HAMP domain-containing protein [Nitrosopumilaceae archaeon]NIU02169.1 HAMP domain-containing protein [Nitrosopumilaceae archaeon]NIU88641.1 HAMP domain-containing protein [Nitrosopumilaceae archaeon]NIV64919.1 HAMP domain-containing protein [Nitrosopumilaceae archaeon]NIX62770.1 HAMP domain-containing protein [Nitrosopumilaceae archaeon]